MHSKLGLASIRWCATYPDVATGVRKRVLSICMDTGLRFLFYYIFQNWGCAQLLKSRITLRLNGCFTNEDAGEICCLIGTKFIAREKVILLFFYELGWMYVYFCLYSILAQLLLETRGIYFTSKNTWLDVKWKQV